MFLFSLSTEAPFQLLLSLLANLVLSLDHLCGDFFLPPPSFPVVCALLLPVRTDPRGASQEEQKGCGTILLLLLLTKERGWSSLVCCFCQPERLVSAHIHPPPHTPSTTSHLHPLWADEEGGAANDGGAEEGQCEQRGGGRGGRRGVYDFDSGRR